MDDESGKCDPKDTNASTTQSQEQVLPAAIESPPISREKHNYSLVLMRSMMEEVRQLRLEVSSMRTESTNAPSATQQTTSIGLGEIPLKELLLASVGIPNLLHHLPMPTQPMFNTLILIRLGTLPLLMHLILPIGNS